MNFKERSAKIAKKFRRKEVHIVETLTIMHELIAELVDCRIPIRLKGFFRTRHRVTGVKDSIKVGRNKRLVKSALANNRNLYIRTEHKFVNSKKELYGGSWKKEKHQNAERS